VQIPEAVSSANPFKYTGVLSARNPKAKAMRCQ
jgi:hypothetical protein